MIKNFLMKPIKHTQNIPDYNGKIWEHIKGWSCEGFLKECVKRNNLSKNHLVSKKKYIMLLQHIISSNTHDPSHKNIMIEGICHYAFPNKNIIQI